MLCVNTQELFQHNDKVYQACWRPHNKWSRALMASNPVDRIPRSLPRPPSDRKVWILSEKQGSSLWMVKGLTHPCTPVFTTSGTPKNFMSPNALLDPQIRINQILAWPKLMLPSWFQEQRPFDAIWKLIYTVAFQKGCHFHSLHALIV